MVHRSPRRVDDHQVNRTLIIDRSNILDHTYIVICGYWKPIREQHGGRDTCA